MNLFDRVDDAHRSLLRAIPEDFLDLTDIPAQRASFAAAQAALAKPLPDDVVTEDHLAPGPADAPDVLVRTYRRRDATDTAPGFYWIHGGGMVMGDVASTDAKCAAIALKAGVVVGSVEYRLAPEHPFPAPLDDCYAGLLWFHHQGAELGVDTDRIGIGGASAGGGLAAGLALLARDRGEVDVCYQHLVYPMLDDRNETRSSHEVTDPRVWNRRANQLGWDAYLAGGAGGANVSPYAAPSRAGDLSGLPPTYLPVGDLDLFVDEDVAYAAALNAAGVPCELHVYPGAFHGSDMMVSRSALSRRWMADELDAIDRALNG